jgi:hypothetical protein
MDQEEDDRLIRISAINNINLIHTVPYSFIRQCGVYVDAIKSIKKKDFFLEIRSCPSNYFGFFSKQ